MKKEGKMKHTDDETMENDSITMTEVEAKYLICDRETFESLKTMDKIGQFDLKGGHDVFFTDYFLDTADHKFEKAGYYLRERHENGSKIISFTLKKNGNISGNIHRREENVEKLPEGSTVEDIKSPEFCKKIEEVMDGASLKILHSIFSMEQRRVFCNVVNRDCLIAILSFDEVIVKRKNKISPNLSFFELEIELTPEGKEIDLDNADKELYWKFGDKLIPGNLSKYDRARFITESEL